MIRTREDLKYYLECDRKAFNLEDRRRPRLIGDRIWKYQRLYRRTEYWCNNKQKSFVHFGMAAILLTIYKLKSEKWGNEIPINCIGEGLRIWHGQNIIINGNAKIGKNLSVSTGVIIGHAHGGVPVIGDDVSLSVDAKVLGSIHICNHVTIGAGAVVVKDISEPYTSWGGVPAKKLSSNIGDMKG